MLEPGQISGMISVYRRRPDFAGVPIGHYDGMTCRLVDPGDPMTNASGIVGIVIEEVIPAPQSYRRRDPVEIPVRDHWDPTEDNGSRLAEEAINAGLNCTWMAISAVGVAGSLAAEAPTFGLSTVFLVASFTGLMASSVQCGDGLARTVEALANPESDSLARLDRNDTYATYRDLVGTVGLVASAPGAVRATLNPTVLRDLTTELIPFIGSLAQTAAAAGPPRRPGRRGRVNTLGDVTRRPVQLESRLQIVANTLIFVAPELT